MTVRIDKAFDEYIMEITKGKPHGINRLDLHRLTFKAGYEQGQEDKRYELSKVKAEGDRLADLAAKPRCT